MNLPLKINVLFFDTIISYTDRNNYEISVKIYINGKTDTTLTHIFKNTNGKFSFEKTDK